MFFGMAPVLATTVSIPVEPPASYGIAHLGLAICGIHEAADPFAFPLGIEPGKFF